MIVDADKVSLTTISDFAVDSEATQMGRELVQALDEYWKSVKPTVADERSRRLEVHVDAEIHATFEAYAADFGADLFITGPLNGTLVVSAPDVSGCGPSDRSIVGGHVVMALRGECTFMHKAR